MHQVAMPIHYGKPNYGWTNFMIYLQASSEWKQSFIFVTCLTSLWHCYVSFFDRSCDLSWSFFCRLHFFYHLCIKFLSFLLLSEPGIGRRAWRNDRKITNPTDKRRRHTAKWQENDNKIELEGRSHVSHVPKSLRKNDKMIVKIQVLLTWVIKPN